MESDDEAKEITNNEQNDEDEMRDAETEEAKEEKKKMKLRTNHVMKHKSLSQVGN